jgi:hypothetical protein
MRRFASAVLAAGATAGVPNRNTVTRQNVFEARLMMQAQF